MALTAEEEIEMLELENEQLELGMLELSSAEDAPEQDVIEDLNRGQTGARFERGLTALPRGAWQLGANVGDLINEIPGVSEAATSLGSATVFPLLKAMGVEAMEDDTPYGEQLNTEAKEYTDSARRGQEMLGRGSFDAVGLGSEILSGGALIKTLAGFGGAVKGGATIGGMTPVTGGDKDFWFDKGTQGIGGGVFGGAGYGAMKAGGHLGGWMKDAYHKLVASPDDILSTGLVKTLGGKDKADEIANLLEADVNPLTKGSAAEVASSSGSTKLADIQKAADVIDSDASWARKMGQEAERMKVLDDIANLEVKGVSPGQFREEITAPMRTSSLNRATENTAKELELAQRLGKLNESGGYTPMPPTAPSPSKKFSWLPEDPRAGSATRSMTGAPQGGPDAATNLRSLPNAVRNAAGLKGEKAVADAAAGRSSTVTGLPIPKRYSPQQEVLERVDDHIADADVIEELVKSEHKMVTSQIEGMKAHGIEGATPNKIIDGVSAAMKTPDVKGTPALKRIMKKVQKELKEMVEPDGTINPEALYAYRKHGLDVTIAQFLKNTDDSVKATVTSQLSAIKPLLDDVINKAAGGGWNKYLKAYSKLSRPVNQAKVGKVLKESFSKSVDEGQTTPSMLTNAMEAAQKTLKKAGVRGGNLEDVMNPKQMAKLRALRADLQRQESTKQMGQAASGSGKQAVETETPQMANALLRPIMISNHILRYLMSGKVEAAEKVLVKLMQRDPETGHKALVHALRNAPPEKAKAVRAWIDKFGAQTTGFGAGSAAGTIGDM